MPTRAVAPQTSYASHRRERLSSSCRRLKAGALLEPFGKTVTTSSNKCGTVYLVGAGPGDPGLITLRAVECLGQADLVLYDYLANPAALEHAAPSAELVCLGHHASGRLHTPEEITDLMLAGAREGKTVVRLKGGDPSVFGRGVDETRALREAGITFEIIPGITAGLAAAAFCEIPITHHEVASAVALITGRERRGKVESKLDFGALAGFPGTLIFYMGLTKVSEWSEALIAHGKPADTPVAIVRWCSWAKQRMFRCTLETAAEFIEKQGLRPPVLFLVGDVVRHAPQLSWFAARPLYGRCVLVAGSPNTSDKLRNRLASLGAEVISEPAIRIADPPDWAPVDTALDDLEQYDWLVFSSGNGVDYLLSRLLGRGGDMRRLGRLRLAAIGPGTAERLTRYHLRADVVPDRFNAEGLAEKLTGDAQGQRFLLARASRGRQLLAEELQRAGAHVDQVVVYSSLDIDKPDEDTAAAMADGRIDWVTVASSSTAKSLVRLYGDALRNTRLVSISPLTSSALRDLGHEPAVEASPYTTDGLIDAILQDTSVS